MHSKNENIRIRKSLSHALLGGASFLLVLLFASCGGSGSKGPSGTNHAPVASAGPAQNVALEAHVTLDGSGSSDPDGDPLTYQWSFISKPSGSSATLSSVMVVHPTFEADPAGGTYVLQLVVSDGSLSSDPSSVTITAALGNQAPVANAGPDQNVTTGTLVTLDGHLSSDPENDPITYDWTFTQTPNGIPPALDTSDPIHPTFTPTVDGTYTVQLIVNDGTHDSAPDTVTITASPPNIPIASAGSDQSVTVNSTVQLDGSGSHANDGGNITGYHWSFFSKPAGSNATLSDVANPTFTADQLGDFVAQLIVDEGTTHSSPATVTIHVSVGGSEETAFWLLTSAATCVAGTDLTCPDQTLTGMDLKSYATGSNGTTPYTWTALTGTEPTWFPAEDSSGLVQRLWLSGGVAWPATDTGPVTGRYTEFTVSPAAGKTFTVDGIALWAGGGGGSNMNYSIQYSTASDFSSPTVLGTYNHPTSNNMNPLLFTPTVTVGSGQTLYIRIYPWYDASNTGTKYLLLESVKVHGFVY